MKDWQTKPLKNLTSLMTKGIAPAYTDQESADSVRVLNQKCNRNHTISYNESRLHYLPKKRVPEERFLKKGDVLINSTGEGTAGRVAQIWDIPCKTTIDGHMILVRPTKEIDSLFFGYALKMNQSVIENLAEGSTGQTEINRKRLGEEVLISYPTCLERQHKVGRALEVLDEKIANNQKINRNLAATSRRTVRATARRKKIRSRWSLSADNGLVFEQ